MKKPQIIIYTRNRDVDYRMIIRPDENICSDETRKYFRKLIRGAIDVETYDDPLNTPRWLFARKNNCILFGVAVMLESFDNDCCTDFTGRSVRGFFGLVMDASSDSMALPYNLDFFKAINDEYIVPLWDAPKEDFVRKGIEIDIEENAKETISLGEVSEPLNTNSDVCQILGKTDIKDALQSALNHKEDISLISGLNSRQHAIGTGADYDFMNVIINDISEQETINKRIIRQSEKSELQENPESESHKRPKKALRPKIILALLVAAAVIVIILTKTCTTTSTSPNSSTSGETNSVSLPDTTLKKN